MKAGNLVSPAAKALDDVAHVRVGGSATVTKIVGVDVSGVVLPKSGVDGFGLVCVAPVAHVALEVLHAPHDHASNLLLGQVVLAWVTRAGVALHEAASGDALRTVGERSADVTVGLLHHHGEDHDSRDSLLASVVLDGPVDLLDICQSAASLQHVRLVDLEL